MLVAFSSDAKTKWKKIRINELSEDYFKYAVNRIIGTISETSFDFEENKELIVYPLIKLLLYKKHGILKEFLDHEKKRVQKILKNMKIKEILEIVYDIFEIEDEDDAYIYVDFFEYISKSTNLNYFPLEKKLVYIKKNYEELIYIILGHIDVLFYNIPKDLPNELKDIISKYSQTFICQSKKINSSVSLPFDENKLPPCIKKIYMDLLSGVKVGHYERFVIATFLVNIGLEDDKIVDLFRLQENFKEKRTRYHIEYIKKRGLLCPNCEKIKEYGFCCSNCNVKNPLVYYTKKFKKD